MSRTDSYLQFPLCALSFGATEDERLNAILAYGVVYAGMMLWRKAKPEVQNRFMDQFRHGSRLPQGFESTNQLHCAALFGAASLNVNYKVMEGLLDGHRNLERYADEFEGRYKRDPLVRIKRDWFFKVRDRKGLTYREFSVLCAIYSCLGSKPFSRVTQPRIRRCALGYKTESIKETQLGNRADGASPLTARRLRDTIARLHRNNFFARCTYARRMTYYSIRLDNVQLRRRVLERHTYPGFHRASQATQDQTLTTEIKRSQAESASILTQRSSANPR